MDIGQYTVIEAHDRSDILYSLRAAEVSVAHHLVIIVCRIGLKPQRLGHIAVPYGGTPPKDMTGDCLAPYALSKAVLTTT